MSGRVWLAPVDTPFDGDRWTYVGTIDGEDTAVAMLQLVEASDTLRAWARVGPDGVLTMDAPMVEVDPDALLAAVAAQFDQP
jgi:hypothetical protein